MSTLSLFPEDPRIELQVTLDWSKQQITFDWKQTDPDKKLGHGAVWVTGDLLRWRMTGGGETDDYCSSIDPIAVEHNLKYLAERFPVAKRDVSVSGRRFNFILNRWERVPIRKVGETWQFLVGLILEMGQQLADAGDSTSISPEPLLDPESVHQAEKRARREEKRRLQREMIRSRVAEANRRNRERQVAAQRPAPKSSEQTLAVAKPILAVPDVEIRIAPARLPVRDLFEAQSGTDGFLQIERASLMWVSNQSDDLLSLPYCTIDHLEYQIRSALRVTGSLRRLAAHWKMRAPLTLTWERKLAVIPPMTRTTGGLVVFSQFLATQKALAEALTAQRIKTWVLNGQVPAADRQSIVDRFREQGGALLLSRSGTEGRNLQFCHRLANFDLPWNPMEIEQRIGRLHRIGQQQTVEIYNLVQSGTLQAHLLEILQDKLNLFDLVVGEAGLILGERFSSDDFEEEIFRRWQDSSGDIAGTFKTLGEELSRDRTGFDEIKRLDETLFGHDYESI